MLQSLWKKRGGGRGEGKGKGGGRRGEGKGKGGGRRGEGKGGRWEKRGRERREVGVGFGGKREIGTCEEREKHVFIAKKKKKKKKKKVSELVVVSNNNKNAQFLATPYIHSTYIHR